MEKIEFIRKKETPSKFRVIINVNESYNVGAVLNKAEMKAVFYNIKNLLEDRTELNEPEFAKKKTVIVEKEVEKELSFENVVAFLNDHPEVAEQFINHKNFQEATTDVDDEEVVIVEDEETTVIEVDELMEEPKKNKKKFFGFWALLCGVGGAGAFAGMNPEVLSAIVQAFGM